MKPLENVCVVDLSRYAPGPFATLTLAGLGAEVIKIEPPGGDPMRGLDSSAFERLNRGKKSVVLDLKTEEGRKRLVDLTRSADVLVDSFRPGARARLGLDPSELCARAPRLVHASLLGYDPDGPYRERAGHDINYMAVTGALRGAQAPSPLQVADFAAGGLYAALAILAALMERNRTGRGARIELAMARGLETMMQLAEGPIEDKLSGRYPNYAIYETRDGRRLSVGALEPKFWRTFCDGIERADLVERMEERAARDEVAAVVRGRDASHWTQVFAERDACVELVEVPRAPKGAVLPFGDESELGPAPRLGEHTAELFG